MIRLPPGELSRVTRWHLQMDQFFRICRSCFLLSIPNAVGIRKSDRLACRCQHRPILGAEAAQCLADDHPKVCPLLKDVCQWLGVLSAVTLGNFR